MMSIEISFPRAVPAATAWRPLADQARAARAATVVAAIADALRERDAPAIPAATLHAGAAGNAIFFAELARANGRERDRATALASIDRATEALEHGAMNETFFAGFTGIAWADELLADLLFEADVNDGGASDEIDDAVARRLDYGGHFDLVSGLVGLGVYALARHHRAPLLIERVLDRLAELAETGPGTATWFTPTRLLSDHERERAPNGFHNLGLAHGVPGVVALLGHAVAAGHGGGRADALLRGAIAWLLAQQLPDGAPSMFAWWSAAGDEPRPARAAWCYGDPGIAVALSIAAHATGDPDHFAAAMRLARFAAQRPLESCMVEDAGLCHGSAGLMHMFNRLWQATGDETCRSAAITWFDRTLAYQGSTGVAGYEPHGVDPTNTAEPGLATGVLNGAAGIGLSLLAATSSVEPAWDRMLLLDVPPHDRRGS